MTDKPKRWTWKEWINACIKKGGNFNSHQGKEQKELGKYLFMLNEPYIEYLEAENEKNYQMNRRLANKNSDLGAQITELEAKIERIDHDRCKLDDANIELNQTVIEQEKRIAKLVDKINEDSEIIMKLEKQIVELKDDLKNREAQAFYHINTMLKDEKTITMLRKALEEIEEYPDNYSGLDHIVKIARAALEECFGEDY